MNSHYEIIIFWSTADDCFVAEVPELAGCMADGRTYQEALANAEIAMQEWIETARDLGRSIPEPRGRLRLPVLVFSPCSSLKPSSRIGAG